MFAITFIPGVSINKQTLYFDIYSKASVFPRHPYTTPTSVSTTIVTWQSQTSCYDNLIAAIRKAARTVFDMSTCRIIKEIKMCSLQRLLVLLCREGECAWLHCISPLAHNTAGWCCSEENQISLKHLMPIAIRMSVAIAINSSEIDELHVPEVRLWALPGEEGHCCMRRQCFLRARLCL